MRRSCFNSYNQQKQHALLDPAPQHSRELREERWKSSSLKISACVLQTSPSYTQIKIYYVAGSAHMFTLRCQRLGWETHFLIFAASAPFQWCVSQSVAHLLNYQEMKIFSALNLIRKAATALSRIYENL